MLKGTLHSRIKQGEKDKKRKRKNHIQKLLADKLKRIPKVERIVERPISEVLVKNPKTSFWQKIKNFINKIINKK